MIIGQNVEYIERKLLIYLGLYVLNYSSHYHVADVNKLKKHLQVNKDSI